MPATMAAAGTEELLAPEHPPQKTSRYRTLRGKSVSSHNRILSIFSSSSSYAPDLPSHRLRSKSVAGLRNGSASISKPHPLPPDVPPIPSYVNGSKVNGLPKRLPAPPTAAQDSAQSRTEKEIDDLAAQLDQEIDEAKRRKGDSQRRKEEEEAREAARYADEVARLEAETDRILAEQRKRDLARLQAQLSTPPQKKRVILDKLTLFSRPKKQTSSPNQPPGTPSTIAPTIFTPDLSRSSSIEASPPPERMSFIDQGPKSRAPISAINGGERRVTVRCFDSTVNLEVTADTSPIDILQSIADLTAHQIDTNTSIVVECYFVLGLERRVRRYERIRDILNSWERDAENSLLIECSETTEPRRDLEIEFVPKTDEPVTGFTLQLYHSARPGKWNKRFVTLLTTGQMFAAKRPDAQVHEKDSTTLCHLSDFDIYSPKESETRRHLKPPKKFCFAIKSQQKTVVFPNGENFVHFFCTDDADLAERFYELVHAWRSWYLVNRQVNLRTAEKAPQITFAFDRPTSSKSEMIGIKPTLQVPVNRLSSLNGSFIDEKDFTKAIEESTIKLAKEAQRSKSLDVRKPSMASSLAPTVMSEREFAADGLLGDTYDKRKVQEAAAESSAKEEKADSPFTEGPSLLNALAEAPEQPQASSWFPSAAEHSLRVRSDSVHHVPRPMTADSAAQPGRDKNPRPLLNLAGDFPEPPRSRDGMRLAPGPLMPGHSQGRGVRAPTGSPLVDYATGNPNSTPRRLGPPPGNGGPPPPPPASARGRSRSTAAPHSSRRGPPDDLPPVPPMPHRGGGPGPNGGRRDRMPMNPDMVPRVRDQRPLSPRPHSPLPHAPRHREPRHQEPLVNRAR